MINKRQATVFYAPTARRRYFTKRAAINSEARAIIRAKYPTEQSEHDDSGRCTFAGWHFEMLDNYEKMHRRMCFKISNA